jgi:hypothetical protein
MVRTGNVDFGNAFDMRMVGLMIFPSRDPHGSSILVFWGGMNLRCGVFERVAGGFG